MRGRPERDLGAGGQPISPLGAAVRAWRKRRGLSVSDLAVRAGLGPNGRGYISQIEHGKIRRPHDGHLSRLARVLEVPPADLLLGRGPDGSESEAGWALRGTFTPGRAPASDLDAPDPQARLLEAIERLERVAERLAALVPPGRAGDDRAQRSPADDAAMPRGPDIPARAGGPRGAEPSFRPFVGRERELRTLHERFELTRAGRGQIVLVSGEAGIGKSRLLREFRRQLSNERVAWLEGRCRSDGGAFAYLPLVELTRDACGIVAADPPAAIADRVRATLQELGTAADEWAPYLIELLGVSAGAARLATLGPGAIQSQTFAALRQLLLATARRRPLVVALEDLHWIDDASEAFVASLAEWVADAAILLLCGYRPGYRSAWVERSPVTQIALQPLALRESLRVLDAMPTRPVPEPVTQTIADTAEGNPLFLEELAWALDEQGDVPAQAPAPDTLPSVLRARIEQLAEQPRSVLQAAAVLGHAFSEHLLRAIWDGPGALGVSLLELERLEFLRARADGDEPVYTFKHPLIQHAAYESLAAERRRALHAAAGRALETHYPDRLAEQCGLLAHHYARSPEVDKALEYLGRAQQKAVRTNAMVEATASYRQAMDLLDAEPDSPARREQRMTLLVNQAPAMNLLVKFPEYYEDLERYAPLATGPANPGLEGALLHCRAWCEWTFGWFERAIESATRGVQLCEAAGDAEGAAAGCVNLQWDHLYRGDLRLAREMERRASERMNRRYNVRWHFYGLMAASMTSTWLGRWDEALDAGRKALRLGEEFLDASMVTMAALSISLAYLNQVSPGQAAAWAELAVDKAATPSDRLGAQATLASAWILTGQPERGVPALVETLARSRAARFIGPEHLALFLVDGYRQLGDEDRALQALREHLHIAERSGMKFCLGAAYRRLGAVAMEAKSDPERLASAAAHFEQSINLLRSIGAENELALAYADHGRLHRLQGDVPRGREYLMRALEIFERLATLVEPDGVRRELAELPAAQQQPTRAGA